MLPLESCWDTGLVSPVPEPVPITLRPRRVTLRLQSPRCRCDHSLSGDELAGGASNAGKAGMIREPLKSPPDMRAEVILGERYTNNWVW